MPAPTPGALVDTVDEADAPIGVTQRAELLSAGRNFRVVHVFVIDGAGRLLLQQLAPGRERHANRWGSSVAGYLHAGEPEWAGARRRLREELGLTVSLRKHGAIAVRDENSTKFVTLYTTFSDHAAIREPAHIQSLDFLSVPDIERRVRETPERFTPTFRQLLHFYTATAAQEQA